MVIYLDSSALLKRYVQEIGTQWVIEQCDPINKQDIATALITKVEAAAALAAKLRHHQLTLDTYKRLQQDIAYDFTYEYRLVTIDLQLIDFATRLTTRQKLRGYDAIQLAAALILNNELLLSGQAALTFVASDINLLTSAANEGLLIDNPLLHP